MTEETTTPHEEPLTETQAATQARWATEEEFLRTAPIAKMEAMPASTPTKPIVVLDGDPALIKEAVRKALMRAGQGKQAERYVKRTIGGPAKDVLAISLEFVDLELRDEPKK